MNLDTRWTLIEGQSGWLRCGWLAACVFLVVRCDSEQQDEASSTVGGGGNGAAVDGRGMMTADNVTGGEGEVDPQGAQRLQSALWPMMGFDARNNYHNPSESHLSPDNVDKLEVKWTFEVAGYPPGTPVIAEGKVFVLATGGLYAIDFATGREVWSKMDVRGTSSVAYHDGSIFVHTAAADLYRLNAMNGEVQWGPVQTYDWPRSDGTSSPIVANGKVFVGHSTTLEIFGNNPMAQTEARGGVRALKIEDGSDAWHYFTTELPENGAMVWSSVAADETAVYATTGNNYTVAGENSDAIHAISDADGSRLWRTQVRQGDVWVLTDPMLRGNPDVDFGANPIVAEFNGVKMVAAGDKESDFWAMDLADGTILWRREDITNNHAPNTGGILNNGAFDGNAFYAVSNQPPGPLSRLVAMNPVDGTDLWAPKDFDKYAWGMPTSANGLLVVPIDDEIHILNAATGDELKVLVTGGTIAAGAVAVAGGRLVVGSGLQYQFAPGSKNNNEVICYGLVGDAPAAGGDLADDDGDAMAEPTWTRVWEEVVVGTGCNGNATCHAADTGGLQLTDKNASYTALVGVPAMGTNVSDTGNMNCVDSGLTRVVAGNADESLLQQKLEDKQTCGGPMPPVGDLLDQEKVALVRAWIEAGAQDN